MQSKAEFIKKHRGKSEYELNLMKSSMLASKCKNTDELVNAIDELLINAKAKAFKRDRSFDEYVAFSYLRKIDNAKERCKDFELSLSDWRRLMSRRRCAYTGVILLDEVEMNHPSKRTIDRIDNKIGYTKENCVAVSFQANQLKSALFESNDTKLRMDLKTFLRFSRSIKNVLG